MNQKTVKNNSYIKALLGIAKKEGVRVRFTDKAIYGWAFGAYCERTETIEVCLRTPHGQFFSMADVVFILIHELRHHYHKKHGMFKNYYSKRVRDRYFLHQKRSPEHYKESLAAERDCDRVARELINELFPKDKSVLRNRLYPGWRVHPSVLPAAIYNKRRAVDFHYRLKKILRRLGNKNINLRLSAALLGQC